MQKTGDKLSYIEKSKSRCCAETKYKFLQNLLLYHFSKSKGLLIFSKMFYFLVLNKRGFQIVGGGKFSENLINGGSK